MKKFMDENFLLESETAKKLYHEYAKEMPIIDYHCHINPKEIYEDNKFNDITEVWLLGDHYKWRQIRSNGFPESVITEAKSSNYDKFMAFAATMPKLVGNPLYHWSHLELQRYFDFDGHLSPKSAAEVWELSKEKLSDSSMSIRNIIRKSKVEVICTTDDPIDKLEWHIKLSEIKDLGFKVLPAWRPDKIVNIEKTDYQEYLAKLELASGIKIDTYENLKLAILNRLEFFRQNSCTVSDHGLNFVYYSPASEEEIKNIFKKKLAGGDISLEEEYKFKTAVLIFMAKEYAKMDWVMQLHYSCKRDNNSRLFKQLGPDTGFDCISDYAPISGLTGFLDALDSENSLPKTIIYSLNPNDDALIGTVIGCFQGEIPGKVQQGSAWWFNDHKEGMIKQLKSLANLSCLGNFNGMLTDSRSFLSYTRHEYFRRILCNLIGQWVENGECPDDDELLKTLIQDICYFNAKRYFKF